MQVRIVTLRYDDNLHGFPQDAVTNACAGCELLEVREHFFVHGNVPHLALVLVLGDVGPSVQTKRRRAPDPEESLPEALHKLYRDLRQWRNERAKRDGVPSYVIMRNIQVAEICRNQPHSLAALKEIEGIGEATCTKYGKEILGLIPDEVPGASEKNENPEQIDASLDTTESSPQRSRASESQGLVS